MKKNKAKWPDSQAYNYVMRRVHEVQLEDVIANTRNVVTGDRITVRPSQAELDRIMPSCSVKVFHNYEIFWVSVQYVAENVIGGFVSNHLLKDHPFAYGDILLFDKSDVIEIFWPTS